jgi:hypothetical protein
MALRSTNYAFGVLFCLEHDGSPACPLFYGADVLEDARLSGLINRLWYDDVARKRIVKLKVGGDVKDRRYHVFLRVECKYMSRQSAALSTRVKELYILSASMGQSLQGMVAKLAEEFKAYRNSTDATAEQTYEFLLSVYPRQIPANYGRAFMERVLQKPDEPKYDISKELPFRCNRQITRFFGSHNPE